MYPPLLYDLFIEIRREQDLQGPGLQEYYLLFDLLGRKKEYPIKDFDDLAFALETIWLKSNQYKNKFRQLLQLRNAKLMQLIEVLKNEPEKTIPEIKKVNSDTNIDQAGTGVDTGTAQNADNVTENVDANNNKKAETTIEEKTDSEDSEMVFSLGTEQAGAGAYFQFAKEANEMTMLQTPFLFTNDYFPVKNRNLLQAWRTLKNKTEGKNLQEIDIGRTIIHTTRKGFFSELLFQREAENQLQLFILIDCSDTMAAVEEFGKELCATALRSDLHTNVVPWYFFNIPRKNQGDDYMVYDESYLNPMGIRKLFGKLNRRNIVVLLYSDAGVLKNNFNAERITETQQFIHFLNRHAGYTAWLNPAPKERWRNTNAENIKEMIAMFETTRTDIEKLMSALKGKVVQVSQIENDVTA